MINKKKSILIIVLMLTFGIALIIWGFIKSSAATLNTADNSYWNSTNSADIKVILPKEWTEEVDFRFYSNNKLVNSQVHINQKTILTEGTLLDVTIKLTKPSDMAGFDPQMYFLDGSFERSKTQKLVNHAVYKINSYKISEESFLPGITAVPYNYRSNNNLYFYSLSDKVTAEILVYEYGNEFTPIDTLVCSMYRCNYGNFFKCTYSITHEKILKVRFTVDGETTPLTSIDNATSTIINDKVYTSTPYDAINDYFAGKAVTYYLEFEKPASWINEAIPCIKFDDVLLAFDDYEYVVDPPEMLYYIYTSPSTIRYAITIPATTSESLAKHMPYIRFTDGTTDTNHTAWAQLESNMVYYDEGILDTIKNHHSIGYNTYTTVYYATDDVSAIANYVSNDIYEKHLTMHESVYDNYRYATFTDGAWPTMDISISLSNNFTIDNNGVPFHIPCNGGFYTIANDCVYNCRPNEINKNTKPIVVGENVDLDEIITVYYVSDWTNANAHFSINSGDWTISPGKAMTPVKTRLFGKNVYAIELDAKSTDSIQMCFNNNNSWDNNHSNDYTIVGSYEYTIYNGNVYESGPKELETYSNTLTLYYYTAWETPYIHYCVDGQSWTNAPGVSMSASEYSGYSKYTIDLGLANGAKVCFNNGNGCWDNNTNNDYIFTSAGTYFIKNSSISESYDNSENTLVTIYYDDITLNSDNIYIHYCIGGNSWTSVPGVLMEKNSNGQNMITLDLGDASSMKFCFNDGKGNWDNNNRKDYVISNSGTYNFSY